MNFISLFLVLIGAAIFLVFGLQLLIMAFQTSILWGLGYVFVPFVSLIFVIVHWEETKNHFCGGFSGSPF